MFKRYLTNFNLDEINKEYYDVIVVGSGVAGLYTALNINKKYSVLVLSKNTLWENNSNLAQGGVAACININKDNNEIHFQDTMRAGNFYNDEKAVRIMVDEAAENIKKLVELGTSFDRDEEGNLLATREGGHSKRRILHYKDETGKEIIRALSSEVRNRDNIKILEDTFAIDLLTYNGKCIGVLIDNNGTIEGILSKATILATGGIGQVYKNTTNSIIATGDGIGMAYRAGAEIIDMEFIQFHPTALYSKNDNKRFLISEAVRGEGAVLRNSSGEAFMEKYHELKDLAPRDVVSRSIYTEMLKEKKPYVYLDITHRDRNYLKNRFPNIFNKCLEMGIDISKDYIPVCPVQHYLMGGIKVDVNGKTDVEGLYACGETACLRVHGANRLASNSLLEGLVFGNRLAKYVNNSIKSQEIYDYTVIYNKQYDNIKDKDLDYIRERINGIMNKYAFILRTKKGLKKALQELNMILEDLNEYNEYSIKYYECINIALVAFLIINAALKREKSLGSHIIVDSLEGQDID